MPLNITCTTHISSIVIHSKGRPPIGWSHVDATPPGAGTDGLVQLEGEGGIGSLGELTLLIQQGQKPCLLVQKDVQDGAVAGVADRGECHALLLTLLLLPLEDVAVEVALQLLIGHIDAQLGGGRSCDRSSFEGHSPK